MEADFAVTFEFDAAPPVTVRGRVAASGAPTLAARAVRDAMARHPRARWSSISILVDRGATASAPGVDTPGAVLESEMAFGAPLGTTAPPAGARDVDAAESPEPWIGASDEDRV